LHGPGVYPRLDYREQFKVAVGTTTYRNRRGSGVDGASSGVRRRRRADQRVIQASLKISPEPSYILGRLRGLTFFSLAECNEAIAPVMQRMNDRPMRNLGLSRRELFEKIERDALGIRQIRLVAGRTDGSD
jgi:hypothetical protein